MGWDPKQYLAFAGHRLRPAVDLLGRVDLVAPRRVVDLGCGPGNVTRLLQQRWPMAEITGIDSSAEMLARAVEEAPAITWQHADIADVRLDPKADLIFSNAALHWLDDHASLLPRLVQGLAPGGVLAVQMPHNHGSPSHTGMVAAATTGTWAGRLTPLLRPSPVAAPAVYYDILRPYLAELDIWESEYLQVLEGPDAVTEWIKGSALKPLLDALDGAEREAFLADYRQRMRQAYPMRADGRTLFPFRRLFLVGRVA